MAGQELVVCEGKFFSKFSSAKLNQQLLSQRHQVRYLFQKRHIRAYRHVAIVPERLELDVDVVLTWDEVRLLSEKVMGFDHYVTVRLDNAVKRYQATKGTPGIPNYDDILPFGEMRRKCRESPSIQVGIDGGERRLRELSLVDAEEKNWKYRDPAKNKGAVNPGNWISAARWLEIVESRHGFGSR